MSVGYTLLKAGYAGYAKWGERIPQDTQAKKWGEDTQKKNGKIFTAKIFSMFFLFFFFFFW